MNLYLKYWPLAYKYNTRISHNWNKKLSTKKTLFNLFWYIFYDIWIWLIPFFYFYLNNQLIFLSFIKTIWLYTLLYIVFSVFYEIGYLHNDIVWKKEKNPTIHIYEKVDNKFYYIQIFTRFILWLLWISLINLLVPEITKYFILIIIITLLIFILHNIIRNYSYNFITLLWLRFMKFSLVFLILYYVFWTFNLDYYLYLSVLYLMFQNYDHIVLFNKRMWWENMIPNWLGKYCYLTISCIILFLFSKDMLFIMYTFIYFLLFIILTPKDSLKLKNTR